MNYSFIRYLEAKKTVDDRALNGFVWETLVDRLPQQPLTILELGAGIGTMVERLATRDRLQVGRYIAIDAEPANIAEARRRLARDLPFSVVAETVDAFDYVQSKSGQADLLIAHAFLDLLDLPTALPTLFSALVPGGLFYLTINFDGLTVFEPTIDAAFDEQVMALYHRSMDERIVDGRVSGDSRSGRHLLSQIPAAGGDILAAGSSDWVVFARDGHYVGDQAYFLHHILHFVETSLTGHPELDAAQFSDWLTQRRAQVEAGQLIYIAHQLDVCGRLR